MWSLNKSLYHSPSIENWPTVSTSQISSEHATKFLSKKKAIELYFAGVTGVEIEKRTGVTRTYLPVLARRCLELSSDGRIFGFRALLPYIRTQPNQRKAPIKFKNRHQQGGHSGALEILLKRFPNIEDELIRLIRQDAKKQEVVEYKLSVKSLHNIFIDLVKQNGIQEHEWPFNTQYRGVRTIQKFMAKVLNENFSRSVLKREEPSAKAHLNVGTGYSAFLSFDEPYDAVEIDAYRIDSFLTAVFLTPEGTEVEIPLERLWLIAAVDRASTAVLAYSVIYRSEVTSDDVVKVIRDAVSKKWCQIELTIPLTYPEKGGLPSGVISDAFGACWSVTLFDGALAHLAKAVHEKVRKTLGFTISWGAPGHFERRPNVERTFGKIAKDIFKRLPSTTGSNPFNGRAPDAEKQAVRYKLRARDAEQILDVYLAQHNATPCEGISFLSPLEFINAFVINKEQYFKLRKLPNNLIHKIKMFTITKIVTVRGGRKDGRRPYIQLDRVHYTSPILNELDNLIGKKIIVEIDEDDYRQAKAYLFNGAELGFLTAQGRWSETKHSRRTRIAINSLLYKRVIALSEFDDPVRVYLSYLSLPEINKKNKPQLKPSKATDASRIAKESGLEPILSEVLPAKSNRLNHDIKKINTRRSLIDDPIPTMKKIKNRI